MTQNGQTISLAGSRGVRATDTKYSREESKTILETTERYFAAAEKLQREGALDQIPYDDPQVQIETVVQWGVWQDSSISQTTEEIPATKEDLTSTIQDQIDAKEDSDLTPQQESQIDQGVEDIWAAVDLTAKNVEATQG